MEGNNIEVIKKMRDICDDIITAHENEDEKAGEAALGRMILLLMQLEALK